MLLAALLAAGTPVPDAAPAMPHCRLIFPVAPDAAVARRIAEAVIAGRRHPRSRYVLKVMPDRDDPAHYWRAYQSLPPPPRPAPPGSIWVVAGGGGLGMRIDRCTGEVSELFYQR
jgi:hypothetical protein